MKNQYINTLLKGAFILGVIYTGVLFLDYAFRDMVGGMLNWILSFLSFAAIVASVIYFGREAAAIKDVDGAGYSYGAAVWFAIRMLAISGIIVGIGQWVLQNVVDPEYYEKLMRKSLEMLLVQTPGLSESQVEMFQKTQEIARSLWGMVMANVLSMILLGGVVSLVTSVVVKRKADIFRAAGE